MKKIRQMTLPAKIFPLVIFCLALLAACGNSVPSLAQPGQPTLVFIYTDN